ncbi:MAG TPA: sigma-70 family RNA polymerase sigma factor [Acidimicrobiales bacterium]|nr:sigma-70 family RNA polymerase sigma factor [Acidimicrobiales bacterium]
MWDASDEALLAGFATGEPTATAVFVRRFQRRLYGLALTFVVDEDDAADVAQEAFVRAWRHAGAYDARRGSVATWLLTITRNLALDHLRSRRARPADPVEPATIDLTSGAAGPAELAVRGDEVARAAAALRGLPEGQRRALVLAALAGRTAREIGELDGIPVGTAKTRIRTALLHVRDVLAAQEPPRD